MSEEFVQMQGWKGWEELDGTQENASSSDVEFESPECFCHPLTGEISSVANVDELLQMYATVESEIRQLSDYKRALQAKIVEKAAGDTKTRHVIGDRFKATVTMPSVTWENAKLKEAWDSYPGQREQYLQIAAIKPLLRKVDMLERSSGSMEFMRFRELVMSAKREPTSLPTVKVKPVEGK